MHLMCFFIESKTNTGDVGSSQNQSAGIGPTGPSLGGLFAAGFPTLRPIGHRDLPSKTKGEFNTPCPQQTHFFCLVY